MFAYPRIYTGSPFINGDQFTLVPVYHLSPFINGYHCKLESVYHQSPFINGINFEKQGSSVTKGHANTTGINAGANGNDAGGIYEDLFRNFCIGSCASLEHLHGSANPLCEFLNGYDSLLTARGANAVLVITQWGMITAPSRSVNGGKLILRIPKINQFDCAYLDYCSYQSKLPIESFLLQRLIDRDNT